MIGSRPTRSTAKRERSLSSATESAVPSRKNPKRQRRALDEVTIKVEPCYESAELSNPPGDSKINVKVEIEQGDIKIPMGQIKSESIGAIKSENHTDDSLPDDEMTLERKRQLNMEQNAMFLSSLGISKDMGTTRRKSAVRPLKKKEKKELAPRRASLRLQRITPSGEELPPLPEPVLPEPEHPRKPAEPTSLREYVWERNVDEHIDPVLSAMKCASEEKPKKSILSDQVSSKFVSQLSSMRLKQFVKATPERIFSVAFHPAANKMLAIAGDKWGHLAFWDVACGANGVSTFVPHSRPINHIICSPHDNSKVYTAAYDGTLRVTDLNQATFQEVYATDEDEDIRLTRFDMVSPQSLIVSQGDGCISIVDTRSASPDANTYHVHDRLVKCVNVHPVQKDYFLTATNGGEVCLWDIRKLSKKKCSSVQDLPHSKSVDAAHFSPVNGNSILTTCYSNRLHIYDSSNLSNIRQTSTITHDNQTGRWLTNFRAEWHPQREDLFVIGSMRRPRQIELFSTSGQIVKVFSDDLSSVCSLNAFHPTLNALVGANSSGRLAAFY